jgi:hypothetical protein
VCSHELAPNVVREAAPLVCSATQPRHLSRCHPRTHSQLSEAAPSTASDKRLLPYTTSLQRCHSIHSSHRPPRRKGTWCGKERSVIPTNSVRPTPLWSSLAPGALWDTPLVYVQSSRAHGDRGTTSRGCRKRSRAGSEGDARAPCGARGACGRHGVAVVQGGHHGPTAHNGRSGGACVDRNG